MAVFAAGPKSFAASSSVFASSGKVIGSVPICESTCVSPMYMTWRSASGVPSPLTGVMRRIVPTRRSVKISSSQRSCGFMSGSMVRSS